MEYMVEEYQAENYFSMGPRTLSSAILDFCDRGEALTDPGPDGAILSCFSGSLIRLLPPTAFYAVDNAERNVFFSKAVKEDLTEKLRSSYLSHIYEAKNGIAGNPDTLYGMLANTYCPLTYKMALKEIGVF